MAWFVHPYYMDDLGFFTKALIGGLIRPSLLYEGWLKFFTKALVSGLVRPSIP